MMMFTTRSKEKILAMNTPRGYRERRAGWTWMVDGIIIANKDVRKDTHKSRLSSNRATVSVSYAVLHSYHPLLATAPTRRGMAVSLRRISRRYSAKLLMQIFGFLLL